MQSSHLIYQHNGSYVEFYDFHHERQLCASSNNIKKEFNTIETIVLVLFNLVPWCIICILNIIITWKIKQQETWEQANHRNRQVISELLYNNEIFYTFYFTLMLCNILNAFMVLSLHLVVMILLHLTNNNISSLYKVTLGVVLVFKG